MTGGALGTLARYLASGLALFNTLANNILGFLLRIFIGESDRCEGHPLYEAIVNEERRLR